MLWGIRILAWLCILPIAAPSFAEQAFRSLEVKASGYVSTPGHATKAFSRTASGHALKPGMKVIAVSPDLIEAGLTEGTVVNISGLPGEYVVLDIMAAKWTNKIDIYFGNDLAAAKRWGVRKVTISWIGQLDHPQTSSVRHTWEPDSSR
jgi:3D (Asp-Asp-Asp) domain-containing protein